MRNITLTLLACFKAAADIVNNASRQADLKKAMAETQERVCDVEELLTIGALGDFHETCAWLRLEADLDVRCEKCSTSGLSCFKKRR